MGEGLGTHITMIFLRVAHVCHFETSVGMALDVFGGCPVMA